MFAVKGAKNDHPGWHHFDRTGNDNSVVCVYCRAVCKHNNVRHLLNHLKEFHRFVDFTWMQFVVERSQASNVDGETARSSLVSNYSDEIGSAGTSKKQFEDAYQNSCSEVKREASSPVSELMDNGCSSITETYAPTEFDELPTSVISENIRMDPTSSVFDSVDQLQLDLSPCISDSLAQFESKLYGGYRVAGRFDDVESLEKVRCKLNLKRCPSRSPKKNFFHCRSINNSCRFVAVSYHTSKQFGLYVKNEHLHPKCLADGKEYYEEYMSQPHINTLAELEPLISTSVKEWKRVGSYPNADKMQKAIEKANVSATTSNLVHFSWNRNYYKCKNALSCSYQLFGLFNHKEFVVYSKGEHTCPKVVRHAEPTDESFPWMMVGIFTNLNDVLAAQDRQVTCQRVVDKGQTRRTYYRCRKATVGCGYQQKVVREADNKYVLYEYGRHVHKRCFAVAGSDASEDPIMLPYKTPTWRLIDKFENMDELTKARENLPVRFAMNNLNNKKRFTKKRVYYACEKKKSTGCIYRVMTVTGENLFELYESDEHNHSEDGSALTDEATHQLHDFEKKVFQEAPPPKKPKVEPTPTSKAKRPPPPKAQPPPFEVTSSMAECIQHIGGQFKFLKKLPDPTSLNGWHTSRALKWSCRFHAFEVVRDFYRCIRYTSHRCEYIVQALSSETECLLYEFGQHNHPTEDEVDQPEIEEPLPIKLASAKTAKRVFCIRF